MEILMTIVLSGIPVMILVLVLYLLASTHRTVRRIEERLDREDARFHESPPIR